MMTKFNHGKRDRFADVKKQELSFWENPSRFDDRKNRKFSFEKPKVEVESSKIPKKKVDKPSQTIDNVQHIPVPVLDPNQINLDRLRKVCEENSGIKGKQVDISEGFIYCLSNPAWPEWVKVGETIDYESRLKTYQTSSPMTDYKMFLTWWVEDRKMSEREILNSLKASGFEVKGEWIKISQLELLRFLSK